MEPWIHLHTLHFSQIPNLIFQYWESLWDYDTTWDMIKLFHKLPKPSRRCLSIPRVLATDTKAPLVSTYYTTSLYALIYGLFPLPCCHESLSRYLGYNKVMESDWNPCGRNNNFSLKSAIVLKMHVSLMLRIKNPQIKMFPFFKWQCLMSHSCTHNSSLVNPWSVELYDCDYN
jgi:hypothetical protein